MCTEMCMYRFTILIESALKMPGTALPHLSNLICKILFFSTKDFQFDWRSEKSFSSLSVSDWSLSRTLQVSYKRHF